MTQVGRCAFSLLPLLFLWACTSTEQSALPISGEHSGTTTSIQLDRTIHFTAPDGTPVLAAPDEYLVERAADMQIRLVSSKGASTLVVAADNVTHDIDLSSPFPLLLALNEDARNLVLLLPDGIALDATGSLSGVTSREIVRQRRHYQLSYRLDSATGQVTFGDGAMGRRPPATQSKVLTDHRTGTGGTFVSENKLGNLEIQNVLSQYNQAEALAKAIHSAHTEHFRLEYNQDRPGGDYAHEVELNPEACRAVCLSDGNCQAFTFVKPPSGSSTGQCYLKRTVPASVASQCCISGKRKSAQEEIRGKVAN